MLDGGKIKDVLIGAKYKVAIGRIVNCLRKGESLP